jgi:hypothetical protein
MRFLILAAVLFLPLAACQAPPPAAPRGPEMPAGTGPVQYEEGFSRLCQQHPHQGTCP